MNPCHTNRLRPRDRVASVSPTPSPHASPTSSRRSETLPNPTFNKKENPPIAQSDYKITTLHENAENSNFPTIEITQETANLGECQKDQPSIPKKPCPKKTRPRSGSWGGANESEDEIHVVRPINQKLNDECLNIEETSNIGKQEDSSEQNCDNLLGGKSNEDRYTSSKMKDQAQNIARGNEMEEKLRRRLAFHFMDPVEKFIARRQVPWKLLLQFLKVILVTAQLLVFGYYRYAHSNYYSDNRIGFEHLFLGKLWDPVREIDTYPPSTGALAIYDKETFYEAFNSTVEAFHNMESITVNPIFKNSSFGFCIESFKGGGNVTKDLRIPPEMDMQDTETNCIKIHDKRMESFDSKRYLLEQNFTIPWDTLNRMYFNFSVTTVTYRRLGTIIGPECFRFAIVLLFDNSDHDGQIPISLQTQPERLRCPSADSGENTIESTSVRLLNLAVILVCLVSLILCCRALSRAQKLGEETKKFFKVRLKIHLTLNEMWQFLNLWYVLICINDLLLITGSVITEMLETKKTTGDLWDFCSIFLGTGNLLVWIGMLRYLGFFPTYNALILTLKGAFPNVARFVICAGLVYAGFTFCGWIVFAPYHFKFRTLGSTSECLFSLINGDDMFATFSMLPQKLGVVHGFSRLFLYSFVMLFIYVVLSLFIAIIMDTYEHIKEYYKVGFPRSRVDDFYLAVPYDPYSDMFIDGSSPSLLYNCWARVMLRYYGEHWPGYHRHCKSNCRQYTNPNYSSFNNDVETTSYEQIQAANDVGIESCQVDDALDAISNQSTEQIAQISSININSRYDESTPLL